MGVFERLHSSIGNTVNLFTGSQSTQFAGHSIQNPVLCQNCSYYLILRSTRLSYLLLYLSPPSIPLIAQLLTAVYPTLSGNLEQHGLNLHSGNTLWQVRDRVCIQHQYLWKYHKISYSLVVMLELNGIQYKKIMIIGNEQYQQE